MVRLISRTRHAIELKSWPHMLAATSWLTGLFAVAVHMLSHNLSFSCMDNSSKSSRLGRSPYEVGASAASTRNSLPVTRFLATYFVISMTFATNGDLAQKPAMLSSSSWA